MGRAGDVAGDDAAARVGAGDSSSLSDIFLESRMRYIALRGRCRYDRGVRLRDTTIGHSDEPRGSEGAAAGLRTSACFLCGGANKFYTGVRKETGSRERRASDLESYVIYIVGIDTEEIYFLLLCPLRFCRDAKRGPSNGYDGAVRTIGNVPLFGAGRAQVPSGFTMT